MMMMILLLTESVLASYQFNSTGNLENRSLKKIDIWVVDKRTDFKLFITCTYL